MFLSARARGVEADALESALYEERTLLRMIGMRRTLFVLPLDVAAVAQAACTEKILAASRRRYAKLIEGGGIAADGEAWLNEVSIETLRALEERGEAYAAELSRDVPPLREKIHFGEGKTWASSTGMTSWVLFLLAAEGHVVRGRPRGAWTSSQWRWAPAASWLAKPLPRLDPDTARVELATHWLGAFGPASVADLKWWAGWTLAQTRAALDAAEAVEVDLEGVPGFVLPDDLEMEQEPEPWAAFLPSLDPTMMGWKERDWYLGGHGPVLFDRNGNAGPTVWWNGRVVGGWAGRKDGEVAFRLLEDVGSRAERRIVAEAKRLQAWLAETRVTPRFATPLAKELVG